MKLQNNQVSSPKSVLNNKAFEDSSSDSDFDEDWYQIEDNGVDVVIPQTSSQEVSTRIHNTKIHPSLTEGSREDRTCDKIGNPLSPNHIRHDYSICCENPMNMINSIEDLREENKNMISSINEAIKLILAITINMSRVIKNYIRKEESQDNNNE
ncbi:hypothetical protein Tco_0661744 [Tanacetum coccineum]